MLSSFRKSNKMLSKTNYQYLNTPQRILQKKSLKKRVKNLATKNKRLTAKLESLTKRSGISMDSELESDMLAVMRANQKEIDHLPINDFRNFLGATGWFNDMFVG